MVFDFLQPLSKSFTEYLDSLSVQCLGKKITFHTKSDFPNLETISVAIIGVNEFRGSNKENSSDSLEGFRKVLYRLFPGNWNVSIADLGNIEAGESLNDTYFLVQTICEDLLRKKIVPIVIGGSQDLSYPLYRSFDGLDQMVNFVSVDNKFDISKENSNLADSFLTNIIVEEPNNLFNYSNIGFQTYFNSQEEIDLMDKLYFEAYRLGEVSNNLTVAEPVLRDADIVSVDMTSVQSSFSGNFQEFNPNGFTGKEICALSRYAGISDKVSVFGVFNFNDTLVEYNLVAQVVWYFFEGYSFRSNEYPFGSKENYLKYTVIIDDDELVFYKSDKTSRWWIEIPILTNVNNKLKRNTLLPCSYNDYLASCEGEMPERWWKAQRRNIV
ncbi:formimidoylglutamase [Flavobacterium sp.]|uniref:formimidoylglutamase n=1 Tax=Flavobacterium sp. TaxID=239 RepID=UPI003D290A88